MVRKGFGLKTAAIGGLAAMLIAAMPIAHADD
ncbi:MAG: molybdate ABC transporter substrate-binding protein, partial [Mesorhizobium sp.]